MSVISRLLTIGIPAAVTLCFVAYFVLAGPSSAAPASTIQPQATVAAAPSPEPEAGWAEFQVDYAGRDVPSSLHRALDRLQATGRAHVLDSLSTPGRVRVLGEPAAIEELRVLPEVVGIHPGGQVLPPPEVSDPTPRAYRVILSPGLAPVVKTELLARVEQLRTTGGILQVDDFDTHLVIVTSEDVAAGLASFPGVLAVGPIEPGPEPQVGALADGIITGIVTSDATSAPLEGVGVTAYQWSPYVYEVAYTDATGRYTLTVPPGTYQISFTPYDRHIPELYDDVPPPNYNDYTPIVVASGASVSNINASLAVGAQIKGKVTSEETGTPLPSATIYVASDSYVASAITDGSGNYVTEPGLPPGSYTVRFSHFSGNYAAEWYENAPTRSQATPVTVGTSDLTGLDAALSPASYISGTIEGGSTLGSVYVYLYTATDESSVYESTSTNDAGAFRFAGLPAGSYKLRFLDTQGRYLSQWYNGATSFDSATVVATTAGMTATITAPLTLAGTISGIVSDDSTSTPLENILVYAYDAATGSYRSGATTDSTGVYRIGGLEAGTYHLQFGVSNADYLPEYYNDKRDLTSADPVTVHTGMTTTINAGLTRGSRITGRVVDASTGVGIDSVSVSARQLDGSHYGGATTDANGYYTMTALFPGVYRVGFSSTERYHGEYYDNQYNASSAKPVVVPESTVVPNINAALRPGYVIRGTVTMPGESVPVWVYAYRGASSGSSATAFVASDGTYELGPLEPGQYRVLFSPNRTYAQQWYSAAGSYGEATVINVSGDVSGIDATLSVGGYIAGTVTDRTGAPLPQVQVNVYEPGNSSSIGSATTDASGTFAISAGLATGSYAVSFSLAGLTEWYDGQSSQSSATPVQVTAGTTTTITGRISAITGPLAGITGTIVAQDTGLPLGGSVYAYTLDGTYAGYASGSGGQFALSGLPAGTYVLHAYPSSDDYLDTYYNGKKTFESADPIAVSAGITTTGINVTLPRGGEIRGTVSGTAGPLPGALVYAERVTSEGYTSSSAYTSSDGTYRIRGLDRGGYKVQFSASSPYRDQYYNGAVSWSEATTVTVSTGSTVSNINATLQQGGVIAGTIKGTDTGAGIPAAYAYIYAQPGGSFVDSVTADMDGSYVTPGLAAGEYTVRFYGPSGAGYISEWYADASSFEEATPVSVSSSGTVPNIDGTLARGGSISGFVYDGATGAPLSSVTVNAYDATTGSYVSGTSTNSWGAYQVLELPPGSYHLWFSRNGYLPLWYEDATDESGAIAVTVSAAADTPNIDMTLRSLISSYLPVVVQGSVE